MAKDTEVKKRKASVPEVDAEKIKVKKVKKSTTAAETAEAPAKKRKATEDAAPVKVKKIKTPKSVPEQVVVAETIVEVEGPTGKKTKGTKAAAKSKSKSVEAEVEVEAKPKTKPLSKAAKAKAEAAKLIANTDIATDSEDDEDEDDEIIDDQTEALLKGFQDEDDDEDALIEEGMPEGQEIPARKKLTKAEEKQLKKLAESGASDKPGVVYIGRIPHGFFEHEMRAYFEQFGKILNLRLSRNKKNGASKHYGWIQFESTTVADIVARTMDNYLMFGHLLKVKLIPDEQVPEALFKGANKRFKKVPWNKLEGRKLAQGASEEVWDKRVEKEEKKRGEKAKKLQAIGYEFEVPKVKSAKGVAKKSVPAIEPITVEEEAIPAIEAAPVSDEPTKSKKQKKTAKPKKVGDEDVDMEDKPEPEVKAVTKKKAGKAVPVPSTSEEIAEEVAALVPETEDKSVKVTKTKKKNTKVKTDDVVETAEEETTVVAVEPKAKKAKKEKKAKADKVEDLVVDEDKAADVETTVKAKKVKAGKKGKKETATS